MYKGNVEVEQAALAPLAVLAFRLGLTEFVNSCTKAMLKKCVRFLCLIIVKFTFIFNVSLEAGLLTL